MKKESKRHSLLHGWAPQLREPLSWEKRGSKGAQAPSGEKGIASESLVRIGATTTVPNMSQILKAYRLTGDTKWSALIYRTQWHLVLGCALRLIGKREDAEDAAAEIFAKVLEKLRAETPDNLGGWLYTVTRNHCHEIHRKQKRGPLMEPIDGLRFVADLSPANFPDETETWLVPAVQRALVGLPVQQEACVRLFYLEDKSYQEIAQAKGFTIKEVKSYLQNGRRRLMTLLAPVHHRHVSDA